MIKKFVAQVTDLFTRRKPRLRKEPKRIGAAEHAIDRDLVPRNAQRVCETLQKQGFAAYIVGGAVRDLLLGIAPKDFDVATDATPEQAAALFRRSRIIGRRFRLVHVMCGQELVETATFRGDGSPPAEAELDAGAEDAGDAFDAPEAAPARAPRSSRARTETGPGTRQADQHGRLIRDNVFGTQQQDAARRDFTVNALFYDPKAEEIVDYHQGVEDLRKRQIRMIGDPATRYREDPVRMLRAARFEAKLGFTIEPATAEPIARLSELLGGVPAARLFDETLKLFLTGHGARSYAVLKQRGLLDVLLPNLAAFVRRYPDSAPERMLIRGLENTDARVLADKPVTPAFLFALLMYGPVGVEIEKAPRARWNEIGTILDAVDQAMRVIQPRVAVHRRFVLGLRDMFALQPRLESPRGRRALRTLEHPRFRAGFDLLQLRAEFGMADAAIVRWWEQLQAANPQQRAQLSDASGGGASAAGSGGEPAGRRRSRRRGRGGRGRGAGGGGS